MDSQDLMSRMLRSGWGLGWLGIFRFYIIEVDGSACGFVLPEFRSGPWIYSWISQVSLACLLLRKSSVNNLGRSYLAARHLRALQPRPRLKELRITYVAIADDMRRRGIGARTLVLIRQALMDSSTNDFRARTMTAFVREGNTASIGLFESLGFSRQVVPRPTAGIDPLERSAGKLVKLLSER